MLLVCSLRLLLLVIGAETDAARRCSGDGALQAIEDLKIFARLRRAELPARLRRAREVRVGVREAREAAFSVFSL